MNQKEIIAKVMEVNDADEANRIALPASGWVILDFYKTLMRHDDGETDHIPTYVLGYMPDKDINLMR